MGLVERRGPATSASGHTTPPPRRRRSKRFVDRGLSSCARAPRDARLPLRPARGVEAAVAVGQVRDARGGGRRAAARRGARRPLRRGPAGHAGRRGELLAQEARAPPRLSCASRRRVREGGGSIVAYETWLETGDEELLEAIRAYNEEDCRSTLSLRDWLLDEMRPGGRSASSASTSDELATRGAEVPPGPPAWMPAVQALIERLAGRPAADPGAGRRRPGRAPPARAPAALPPPREQARVVAVFRPARHDARRA